jgi:flagellar protein FliS
MNGITAYKQNAITTQSRGRLVVLLYEGAIKFLRQAVKALQAGDMATKGQYISKALAVIGELDCALDMDQGGEIAQHLRSLYQFMYKHLGAANMKHDPQMLEEIISLLEELNEGWKAITA